MEESTYSKKKILIISIAVMIILAVIVIVLLNSKDKKTKYSSDIVKTYIELAESQIEEYIPYEKGMLKIRQDGATAFDSKGKKLWNISYDAINPIADTCGKYAIIADKGNKNAFVTDGTGEQTKISTTGSIVEVCIAKQGVSVIWTSNAETDTIFAYDIMGNKLVEIVTGITKEGTPVDIDLSTDGQKLAVSYLTIEKTKVKNWVTIYNFSTVGQNYTDKVVGSFTYNDAFVPKVEFVGDEHLLVYKDNGFVIYKIKELPELVYEETNNDVICSLVSGSDKIMMVTSPNGENPRKLQIFDLKGKVISELSTDEMYSKLAIFDDTFALMNERKISLYYLDGESKYSRMTNENLRLLVEIDSDEYLLVQEKKAEIIKLESEASE